VLGLPRPCYLTIPSLLCLSHPPQVLGGVLEIPAQPISTEPENAQSSDTDYEALIPNLNDSVSPIPLQTFWGSEAYQGSTECVLGPSVTIGDVGKGKELAWSRGLVLEVSPIKTRSARKKLGSHLHWGLNTHCY
jgi:hypothetical protein